MSIKLEQEEEWLLRPGIHYGPFRQLTATAEIVDVPKFAPLPTPMFPVLCMDKDNQMKSGIHRLHEMQSILYPGQVPDDCIREEGAIYHQWAYLHRLEDGKHIIVGTATLKKPKDQDKWEMVNLFLHPYARRVLDVARSWNALYFWYKGFYVSSFVQSIGGAPRYIPYAQSAAMSLTIQDPLSGPVIGSREP